MEPILEYDKLARAIERRVGENNWQEVLNISAQMIKLSPGSYKGHFYRANALLTLGQVDQAIAEYGESLKVSPGSLPSWMNLGLAFMQKNDRENAARAFQKVLEIDPANKDAQSRLNSLRQ